jgi:hypothetical protein
VDHDRPPPRAVTLFADMGAAIELAEAGRLLGLDSSAPSEDAETTAGSNGPKPPDAS